MTVGITLREQHLCWRPIFSLPPQLSKQKPTHITLEICHVGQTMWGKSIATIGPPPILLIHNSHHSAFGAAIPARSNSSGNGFGHYRFYPKRKPAIRWPNGTHWSVSLHLSSVHYHRGTAALVQPKVGSHICVCVTKMNLGSSTSVRMRNSGWNGKSGAFCKCCVSLCICMYQWDSILINSG